MAATTSRHHGNYVRQQKTLPMTMPSKKSATYMPTSRVAMSPPELSDSSTVYSRHSRSDGGTFSDISEDYSSRLPGGIDIVDELTDRMNTVFDPMRMDKAAARQAQTSGELNAKQRELAEAQAQMQRRVRRTRARFDETVAEVESAREDLRYSKEQIAKLKARATKENPDAYQEAVRSRHSRR